MGKVRGAYALLLPVIVCGGLAIGQQDTSDHKDAEKLQPGEALFKQRCAVCHSTVAEKKLVGPSLHAELSGPAPKMTSAEVRGVIANGKGAMPGFKAQLSEQDTDDLLAYLKTQ